MSGDIPRLSQARSDGIASIVAVSVGEEQAVKSGSSYSCRASRIDGLNGWTGIFYHEV